MKSILILIVALTTTVSFTLKDGRPIATAYPIEFINIKPKSNLHHVDTKIKLSNDDYDCLARNIYFESGVESIEGKIAVAQVTFNRLNTGRWGNTVCKVVYAKSQFSWTLDKRKLAEKPKGPLWDESLKAANKYLNGTRIVTLDTSTHYHAEWISAPKWTQIKNPVDKIGQHIFYAQK
jgi:spore germination cell wall hydrolase CwlJ-like protein